jgi:hypothetical protein
VTQAIFHPFSRPIVMAIGDFKTNSFTIPSNQQHGHFAALTFLTPIKNS